MNWILIAKGQSSTPRAAWLPEILTNQTTIEFQINMVRRRQCRRNGESLGGGAAPFTHGLFKGKSMGYHGRSRNGVFFWENYHKWRFIAGNIIYKWGIFQQALFDCQRVYGLPRCDVVKMWKEMLKTCKGLAPWYVLPLLQCLRILKQDLFSMFGLSWLTRQNRMSYESANNSRLRFFRNPYDMGRTRNCQEVFGPELKWWGEDGIGLQKKPCPPNEGLSFSAHTVAHFASVLVSHSPLMSIGSSWLT